MAISSIPGGAKHGLGALTHEERQAAQNALAKLKSSGGGLGVNLRGLTGSATVYGGAPAKAGLSASTLIRGQGSDTFIGGARSALAHTGAGSDTVVSGSAKFGGPASVSEALVRPGGEHFSLSTDTISVAGVTAESLKAGHQPDSGTHTITLADKTTITITGVSPHDIIKH